MHNFFNISQTTRKTSAVFLIWLFKNTQFNTELLEAAEGLVNGYYTTSRIEIPEKIESLDVVDYSENIVYLLVNKKDLFVIRTLMSDPIYRKLSDIDTFGFVVENENESLKEKFNVNNIFFIYIETVYTGNLLQIEKNTPFKVMQRKSLIEYLDIYKSTNQIYLDFLEHIKEIEDDSLLFKEIDVKDWQSNNYKGLFKYLQYTLNNGEGKKYENVHYGDLLYFDFFEIKSDGVLLYFRLQHNSELLKVRACFDTAKLKTANLSVLINKIAVHAKELDFSYQIAGKKGREKCTTLGTLSNPGIVVESGKINLEETIKQLKKYKLLIDAYKSLNL
jgi:hypothetical protein